MSTDANYLVDRVGVFRPKQEMVGELGPGEIGFLTAARSRKWPIPASAIR
jgi:GTP-binding protein LepA